MDDAEQQTLNGAYRLEERRAEYFREQYEYFQRQHHQAVARMKSLRDAGARPVSVLPPLDGTPAAAEYADAGLNI